MMNTAPPQLLTRVVVSCDMPLLGQPELLINVQDFLLPLLELGPAVTVRLGGARLLSLWLDVAAFQGASIDEYTGAAMFTALQQSGTIFLDRALKANVKPEIWTSVANFAVTNNDRTLLELLYERLPDIDAPYALDIAANTGDVELVKWIHEHNFGQFVVTEKTLCRAAANAHLDMIQWFVETRNLSDEAFVVRRAMDHAARNGQFEVLRWLRENTDQWWSQHAIGAALLNGHFEMADWMYDLNQQRRKTTEYNYWDADAPEMDLLMLKSEAFAKGDVRVLEWLHQRYLLYPVSKKLTERAMKTGHVSVLDYVKQCGCGGSILFTQVCAAGGSIEAAQWAQVHGRLAKSMAVIFAAAKNGHIDFIRWYWSATQGTLESTYDSQILEMTASRGHFECIRFLLEHTTVSLSLEAIPAAAANGHLELMQFLVKTWEEERPNRNVKTKGEVQRDQQQLLNSLTSAMNQAAENGHFDVVKWIHGMYNLAFEPSTLYEAAKNGHIDIAQFVLKHVDDIDYRRAVQEAATHGHLRIVKYLLSHSPQTSRVCVLIAQKARACGHNHIAQWIENYGATKA